MNFEAIINDQTVELELSEDSNEVQFSGQTKSYEFKRQENGRYLLRMETKLFIIDNVTIDNHNVSFSMDGNRCSVDVRNEQDLLLDRLGFKTTAEIGEGELKAPMPGKILEIMVSEGEEVGIGSPVAILEAMKMENELKAPIKGVITSIAIAVGDSLEKDALILEIESSG